MAAKKDAVAEKVDRLGEIQRLLAEASTAFKEKMAPLVREESLLSQELVTKLIGEHFEFRENVIDPETADALINFAEANALRGTNNIAKLTVRNIRQLDNAAIRKIVGQKRFNEIASVAIKDIEKLVGKADIDSATTGYKPSIGIKLF